MLTPSEPDQPLAHVVVLVVDDTADLRFLVTRVLKRAGATTFSAGSVREALSILRVVKPHVIVSDIAMPDADGYELIHTLRYDIERTPFGRTPAITLTSFSQESDRRRSLDSGFQAHVVKPFDPLSLVSKVAELAALDGNAVTATWNPTLASLLGTSQRAVMGTSSSPS